jgi:hypothetical protein
MPTLRQNLNDFVLRCISSLFQVRDMPEFLSSEHKAVQATASSTEPEVSIPMKKHIFHAIGTRCI